MRPHVLAVAAFAAAAALAACGGGGGSVTPSASATATPTASATATPTPHATATPTPPATSSTSAFTGGNTTASCTSSGCAADAMPAADGGYTVSATFAANDATAGFTTAMYWATFSQITPPFSPGALPSTIGTAMIYLDFVTSATVNFTATPAVTITSTGAFPGTHCGFAFYGVAGSGTGNSTPSWNSMTAVGISEVSPSGNSIAIPAAALPSPNKIQFQANSDQFIALYCH